MVGRTVLGIAPPGVAVLAGSIRFQGEDWLGLPEAARRARLGRDIALIPQDPLTALNPGHTIGAQFGDLLRLHLGLERAQARARAVELLESVQIRSPGSVVRSYPHELSGGMRQRVLIAMAFACSPRLVIADEATTALDVTVQRQVLRLLRDLQRGGQRDLQRDSQPDLQRDGRPDPQRDSQPGSGSDGDGTAVLFITHNLGLVAKLADSVSVIHAGRIVEHGGVHDIFQAPRAEYTRALFAATPRYDRPAESLRPIDTRVTDQLQAQADAYDRAWWPAHTSKRKRAHA